MRWGLGFGLLALGTRLVHIWQTSRGPGVEAEMLASGGYASQVVEFGGSPGPVGMAASGDSVLYPLLLAGLFKLFSDGHTAARLVQALLGAASCVLIWHIGRTVFSNRVAIIAAFAAALYGPFIYFDTELLPAALTVFLGMLALWLLSGVNDGVKNDAAVGKDWVRFGLAGLVLGLAIAADTRNWVFAVVAIAWMWMNKGKGAGHGARLMGVGCGVVLLAAAAGVGWQALMPSPWVGSEGVSPLTELSHRFYRFWHGTEFTETLDPYQARGSSALLAVSMWVRGVAFPFGIVAPLAVLGVIITLRSSQRGQPVTLLLLFVASWMAGALWIGVSGNSRLPAVAMLLLFAAVSLSALTRLRFDRQGVAVGCLIAVLLAVVNWDAKELGAQAVVRHHRVLGKGYQNLGMRANAIREYERAVESGPASNETYFTLVSLYEQVENYEKSIGLLQRLTSREPDLRSAHRALAHHFMRAERPRAAARTYEQLLAAGGEEEDERKDLLTRLGEARFFSGDVRGAIDAYRQALQMQPRNSSVRFQLAQMYDIQGLDDAAQEEYELLLTDSTWYVESRWRLARILKEQGRLDDAEDLLREAIAMDTESDPVRWQLGAVLYRMGRHEEALAYVEPLREIELIGPRVHLFLSKLYGELGREDEARRALATYHRQKRRGEIEERIQFEIGSILE